MASAAAREARYFLHEAAAEPLACLLFALSASFDGLFRAHLSQAALAASLLLALHFLHASMAACFFCSAVLFLAAHQAFDLFAYSVSSERRFRR